MNIHLLPHHQTWPLRIARTSRFSASWTTSSISYGDMAIIRNPDNPALNTTLPNCPADSGLTRKEILRAERLG